MIEVDEPKIKAEEPKVDIIEEEEDFSYST